MSATAGQADGVAGVAERLGLGPDSIVMEMGHDDDVDQELRDAVTDCCGEIVGEDTDEVVDVVLLWWREDDDDLTDLLVDAKTPLAEDGVIWLLTPKPGRDGYAEPSEISEAATTAGLQQTSSINAAKDWSGARLASRSSRPKR